MSARKTDSIVEKRPLELGAEVNFRNDEPRFGPEIEMKVSGAKETSSPRTDADGELWPKQPKNGTVVEAEIRPEQFPHFRPVSHNDPRTTTVALVGGPCDGDEVITDRNAREYLAQVPVDPATVKPFKFDPEARKRGEPNIVQGDYDTARYFRTNDKTAEGLRVFKHQ